MKSKKFLYLASTILILSTQRSMASTWRVITLNPSLTEIIYALDRAGSIVGTVEESDYPENAKKIARIGSYGKPNIEKIIELKPHFVVTFKEGYDEVTPQLNRAKIELLTFDGRGIGDFKKIVTELGERLNAADRAKRLISEWDRQWNSIQKIPKPLSVVIQLEQSPLIVAGGDTFISQILGGCGYANTFQNLKSYPAISLESIHSRNIDIVLILMERLSSETQTQISSHWKKVPNLSKKKILFYDPHRLSRLAPGLPEEAKALCLKLGEKK
jgi:ABC-type Fe3+-hydroxamate transport system substrate-binding protein